MAVPLALALNEEGLCLNLRVLPRASRSIILAPDAEGLLPIRLQAPPVDGAANDALLRLLADCLGCAKGRITILQGAQGRRKRVLIRGGGLAEAKGLATHLGIPLDALMAVPAGC